MSPARGLYGLRHHRTMRHIELIYLKPFRIPPGTVFDYRISSASESLSRLYSSDESATPSEPPVRDLRAAEIAARPVCLLETNNGYVVIDGHHRMSEAARLDLESIPALVYPSDTPRATVLSLSIGGKRDTLTGVEKIIALYKMGLFAVGGAAEDDIPVVSAPRNEVTEWITPFYRSLVGRSVSIRFVNRLLRVLTFPAVELRAFHDLALPLESLVPLLDLESYEREGFLRLRRLCPFTVGEGRELVRLLILSRGRSAFELGPWVDGVESDDTLRRGSAIIRSLKRRIHPTLTGRQRAIEESIKMMKLPNQVRLSPPENLEGDSFSCYVRFSRVEELQHYVDLLQKTITDGTVGRIVDLLGDDTPEREIE